MYSVGLTMPTQIVTRRPRLSKVIDAQSLAKKVDARRIPRPSGPGPRLASVWNASLWRLLRSFGAMKGWRGTRGADIGRCTAGLPVRGGGGPPSGPSGIGVAAAPGDAPAVASTSAMTIDVRRAMAFSPRHLGTASACGRRVGAVARAGRIPAGARLRQCDRPARSRNPAVAHRAPGPLRQRLVRLSPVALQRDDAEVEVRARVVLGRRDQPVL